MKNYSVLATVTMLALSAGLAIPVFANGPVDPSIDTQSNQLNQPAAASDYAIHVYDDGVYAGDGVILPVFEVLEARYAVAGQEFTVEYWFKLVAGDNVDGKELFDHHQPSNEGFWTAFQYASPQLWAGIDTESGNDSTAIHLHTGSGFNEGQWHHYALVRDLNAVPHRLCLYLDGVGSCYADDNPQWAPVADDIRAPHNRDGSDDYNLPLYAIGARVTGAGAIDAVIDELRISDVARYQSNFTPSAFPFAVDSHTVMLFHFDEGSGHKTYGLSSTTGLNLEGTLVKSFNAYDFVPLDPNNPTDAAWLVGMWVDGCFGTTTNIYSVYLPLILKD